MAVLTSSGALLCSMVTMVNIDFLYLRECVLNVLTAKK